ncbi:MAG: chloride channel protein [Alteromonadaceae bacterium]|nr:MAG: chloride channel protein [Alteromonadaceae bacterium]
MQKHPIKIAAKRRFNRFRRSLAHIDALPQLSFLAAIIGVIIGLIIVVFRLLIEVPLSFLLPEHNENFEALAFEHRLFLIAIGSAILILFFSRLSKSSTEISLSHVVERMHNHQGKLPFKNWLVQFFGGVICMVTGQSVGREGPVAHLGAGAASQLGQRLKLPNNSIHTLIGCGVAAAISASFNTPMAGVIFAMEILLLQYTTAGFLPIILSSVIGALVAKALLEDSAFVFIGDTSIASLKELPFVALVGLGAALFGGCYVKLNLYALKFNHLPIGIRIGLAGVLMLIGAALVPEIMGLGYDTINMTLTLQGEAAVGTLIISFLVIAVTKLIVTPIIIGLGVPGGLIGPQLVIGACLGGAIGHAANALMPELGATPGFYVALGMAGMMASVLNAPLTALVTVLELTYNPNIIFSTMLVIVVASVTTRQLFGVKGIVSEQLLQSGREPDVRPVKQALSQAGVATLMNTNFVTLKQLISYDQLETALKLSPEWVVIEDDYGNYPHLRHTTGLRNYLTLLNKSAQNDDTNRASLVNTFHTINLLQVPGTIHCLSAIPEPSSLYDALQVIKDSQTDALYVSAYNQQEKDIICGIITLEAIERYYIPSEFIHASS